MRRVRSVVVNFPQAVSSVYRQFATFSGRASRAEYWYWTLYQIIVVMALGVVTGSSGSANDLAYGFLIINLLPGLAVGARRLRDAGLSPFLLFVGIIPFVGAIILIVLFCMPSRSATPTPATNPTGRFCTTCGSPQFGATFCPNCGTTSQH